MAETAAVRKVLITGASGLLGREFYSAFQGDTQWQTMGLAYSRVKDNLKKVDLTVEPELSNTIKDFKPSVILHSAAERRPDVVEKAPEQTKLLNVTVTENICKLAKEVGAYVIYISTDYVFDGTKPPYVPTDDVNPLNKYGQSKADGEKIVMATSPDNIVLRVPILYAAVEKLDESAVTVLFPKVKDPSKPANMNHRERRYPTHCADVAKAVKLLAESRFKDPSLTGPFHFSGLEMMTKYDMAMTMAQIFGLPTDHIVADLNIVSEAPRPFDCQLDSSRLDALGTIERTPVRDGLKEVLQKFFP